MLSSDKYLSFFNRSLWGAITVSLIFVLTFVFYVRAEKAIDKANLERLSSYQVAMEIRLSSQDATVTTRMYILTGDPIYKQHHQEVLDMRRLSFTQIAKNIVPLVKLTRTESTLLLAAKSHTDQLSEIEFKAMEVFESTISSHEHTNRDIALRMLGDHLYYQAKHAVTKSVDDAHALIKHRTLESIHQSKKIATIIRILFISVGLLFAWTLWRIRDALYLILGGSLSLLHFHISRIGSGDFSLEIQIKKGMENSILGWLSQTQSKLAQIDIQRTNAQKDANRMRGLYAALSQCNQAIVHCKHEAELFTQICENTIKFAGMKMAWIGMLDKGTKELKTVAHAGEGSNYLEDLRISIDPLVSSSSGPTGTTFRENHPVWCQDFAHDPITSQWHKKGVEFGWGSSASLPLHRNGTPYGVINIYSAEINAFDDAAQKLLLEMTANIDYALDNFDRGIQQKILESQLLKLSQAVEQSSNAIVITDSKANIEYVNIAFEHMTGYTRSEVIGQNPRFLKSQKTPHSVYEEMWISLIQGNAWNGELINRRKDGSEYVNSTNITPVLDSDGKTTHYIAMEEDISQRKESEERISYLANFDALTGLPNRIKMDDHLRYTLSLTKRHQGSFALLFLDLDNFKDINDTLGHRIGDLLLIELAKRLTLALRDEDTVARMGGDEFIVLLPDSTADGAALVAQKLLDDIVKQFTLQDNILSATASIGIALYPSDGSDIETLLKNADAAMYRAKEEGRNAYCFFTHEMQQHSQRKLKLSNALHTALERNELYLHYQPQVSASGAYVIGAEALIRWEHPEFGNVTPAEFIPIAEDNGMILPIGEWVLRTAISQAKDWITNSPFPIIMAVNISAIQFRHPNLPNLITSILEEADLHPEYLEIELTEGIAMHNPQAAIGIMNDLHQRGIRMSIDDFGTGYSSLSYLKKFKVYKLKIDQSFVRDISTDAEDKAIVSAIIHMARSLGLQTIAEGVETITQLNYLQEQGCDEIQGYYYSKPLLPEMFEIFLKEHNS